ncbi:MAG: hypothetical protein ABSA69_04830 [Verrucomicrobiota bacterium]|jgi:hypothetical protein
MKEIRLLALAGLFASIVSTDAYAQFADSVVSYTPGTGVNPSYTNPNAALGAPTTFIGYQNADPFNPPYQATDIVGLGVNGSITLQFNTPIQNDPSNPYGLDFIVFGHAGFTEDFSTGTTDGTLFTGGTADVQVSVSTDGVTFYTLNPTLTPVVDGLYPTDASGNPFLPVNPALTAADFAGQDLAGIRALYAGSAGGAGFDLSWAINGNNQSVPLSAVNYVRLDDLSGVAYIDAISVVPEPSVVSLALLAGVGLVARVRCEKT